MGKRIRVARGPRLELRVPEGRLHVRGKLPVDDVFDDAPVVIALEAPVGVLLVPVEAVPGADDHARPARGTRGEPCFRARDELVERYSIDQKLVLDIPGARRQRGSAADDLIEDELDVATGI